MIRQRVIAHYLGQTFAADAFYAAFRIPNFLQNLFGEGVLSASFIPEYAKLRARGSPEDARKLAGAVLGLLATIVLLLVALGVTFAPWLVDLIVPGFSAERRDLAITLVRIVFPGVGLLVLSAWCLGVLNTHRRFFLSYAAPVVWNLAIIGAAIAGRGLAQERLVIWAAWGAVVGSLLQFLIQLPSVWRLTGGVRPSLDTRAAGVATVARNFGPAFVGRGVVQISAFLDAFVASWLPIGAVATISNAQLLYTLPISLFGMSVAAAQLPELSEQATQSEFAEEVVTRVRAGTDQVAFFIIPTLVAFVILGGQLTTLVFRSGAFTAHDALWVWATLAGASIGLLPQAWGRLLNSTYYALGDTRTPMRFAAIRVASALVIGLFGALVAPRLLGVDPQWGTVGLTMGTGLAGVLEYWLLRRGLEGRLGHLRVGARGLLVLLGLALLSGGAGWLVGVGLESLALPRAVGALGALAAFGLVYLTTTHLFRVPQAAILLRRIKLSA